MSVTATAVVPPLARLPHAAVRLNAKQAARAGTKRVIRIRMSVSYGIELRQSKFLAGVNQVGVLNDVAIRLEDPAPLLGIAVHALSDL
jgi:hypothetical protein